MVARLAVRDINEIPRLGETWLCKTRMHETTVDDHDRPGRLCRHRIVSENVGPRKVLPGGFFVVN
jgi:hypothetical protein